MAKLKFKENGECVVCVIDTIEEGFETCEVVSMDFNDNHKEPYKSQFRYSKIKEKQKNSNFKAIIFTQFRDTTEVIFDKLKKIEGIVPKTFVGQTKKSSSEGKKKTGIDQKKQKEIIQEFSKGKIDILIATSIAEEGLDIPEVDAVVFYEPISSAIRKIQRAGRTARLRSGKLIILITKKTKDERSYYASNAREKKMYKTIKNIKQTLKNKTKNLQKKL